MELQTRTPRPFLGIHFRRCNCYGRLYLNREGTAYVGRCPKCGAPAKVRRGEGGTNQRFFLADCPI